MDAATLASELDIKVFLPIRLNLVDGTAVDVELPYLSFVNGQFLYVARATSLRNPTAGVEWLAVRDIASVQRCDSWRMQATRGVPKELSPKT